MQTICMDGECLKNFPANCFKWKKNAFKFDETFMKNYDESIFFK